MVQFHDRALIDGPARLTKEGHLVATARVAKANNIQDYMPSEIGMDPKPDGTPYRIFRPEAEVFARDALTSAAHRPITIDHPREDVSAANWKQLAVGDTGGEILRDGDFLSIPVMVMDAKGVSAARTTHQEFSLGYSADLDMTPGKFGDAEYDGSMRSIRVNHLALCGTARGGAELRIVDERPPHLRENSTMKIKIGDAEVDATNGEAVKIAVQALDAKLSGLEGQVGTLTANNATLQDANDKLTGENAALKQQVEDAAITPAKLEQMVAARAVLVADAKKVGGDKLVTDGKTDAEIRKEAVVGKLGDKAKDMSDAAIEGAFAALVSAGPVRDALREGIRDGVTPIVTDSRTFYEDSRARQRSDLSQAWRGAPKTEAAA